MLRSADVSGQEPHFDFVGMHNIAKLIIYLRESANAAISTAKRLCDQHRDLMAQRQQPQQLDLMRSVQMLLQHKLTLLEVCTLRAETLDSRVKNIMNLVSWLEQKQRRCALAQKAFRRSILSAKRTANS